MYIKFVTCKWVAGKEGVKSNAFNKRKNLENIRVYTIQCNNFKKKVKGGEGWKF